MRRLAPRRMADILPQIQMEAQVSSYTVVAEPLKKKEFDGKFGPMTVYELRLDDDPSAPVELVKKAGNAPPPKGTVLVGNIETTQYGKKLKVDFNADRDAARINDAVRTMGDAVKSPPPGVRVEDPVTVVPGGRLAPPDDRQRSIIRQHSQEMALRLLALSKGTGIFQVTNEDELFAVVDRLTDRFEEDAA